ncbi:E3 SUMO-protein ligase ZBED1-like [Haliotis rubra]|uniref:E3 SUMO-protein ligase ZBED1-like n=1 Tax=Haliotis rubra TaxID=36100 RepID=UPI001EE531E6|nr:E3 SUMO-protein ligase ZBED1-like [Haliotis rubra]
MQQKLDLKTLKLIGDVPTRWNSTYDMLQRYLEQQAAVFATLIDIRRNVKDLVTLNDDDITKIEKIIQVLKPLKTVTTLMCSQKNPTVSLIHPLKEMLLKQLQVKPEDSDLVSELKSTISNDLQPRYCKEDVLKFLLHASALDPRFKALPYLTEAQRHEVYHSIGQKAVKVKTEPAEPTDGTEPRLPSIPTEPTPSTSTAAADDQAADDDVLQEPPSKIKREVEESCALSDLFGDVFVTHVEEGKSVYERTELELQMYKEDEVANLDSDPLSWWRVREGKYPLLSKYAKQCLSTPATSVASERVFSTAGDVVTAQRASLSSDNVNMLVFLSKNIIIPADLVQQ